MENNRANDDEEWDIRRIQCANIRTFVLFGQGRRKCLRKTVFRT